MAASTTSTAARDAFVAKRQERFDAIAARTRYPASTIGWISGALTFIGVYQRRDRDSHHIGAAGLCRMLIADCELYSAPALRERLEHLGIRSSIDIGNIVYELIAEGMCTAGENDSKSDFDTLFNAENFDSYIASLQLRRDGRRVVRSAAVWTLYVAAV